MKQQQIQQFQFLVRESQSKLDANKIVKLNKACFLEYLQKIKHFAGTQLYQQQKKTQKLSKQQKSQTINQTKQNITQRKQLIQQNLQNKRTKKGECKSYYYNQKTQLNSIKELIFFAQQSRKQTVKRKILQRRKSISNYIQNAQKQIQTFRGSNSVRNLRLTVKSAQKTLKKYKQKIIFNPQLNNKSESRLLNLKLRVNLSQFQSLCQRA